METYRVEAYNTATSSENKIHDDEVAQKFGFTGGLVPGVDVYAYLCHPPAVAWGEAWLREGTMSARFAKPAYDGELLTIEPFAAGNGTCRIEVRDPCASW